MKVSLALLLAVIFAMVCNAQTKFEFKPNLSHEEIFKAIGDGQIQWLDVYQAAKDKRLSIENHHIRYAINKFLETEEGKKLKEQDKDFVNVLNFDPRQVKNCDELKALEAAGWVVNGYKIPNDSLPWIYMESRTWQENLEEPYGSFGYGNYAKSFAARVLNGSAQLGPEESYKVAVKLRQWFEVNGHHEEVWQRIVRTEEVRYLHFKRAMQLKELGYND